MIPDGLGEPAGSVSPARRMSAWPVGRRDASGWTLLHPGVAACGNQPCLRNISAGAGGPKSSFWPSAIVFGRLFSNLPER
jgi:hypothetical protein